MMSGLINFFATREDLNSIIQKVAQLIDVKYILNGVYHSKEDIRVYDSLVDYEDFGVNKSGDHQSERFLVLERTDKLNLKIIKLSNGKIRYSFDQSNNEDSIDIWPGGFYGEKYLIHGHIGTISKSDTSKKLFSIFRKCIKEVCKYKIGSYYISDEVKNIYNDVRLITINIKQPNEYDLKILP